jgi:hypothetical protein
VGFGLGFDDWDWGCGKGLWKSEERVGICWWMVLWKSGGWSCLYKMKGRRVILGVPELLEDVLERWIWVVM